MDFNERDVKFFMIRLFRFIIQILGEKLPTVLQGQLQKEENIYFTDSISKAIFILINELSESEEIIPSIDSDEFRKKASSISLHYDPFDFLKFCSCYVMKAALEPSEDTSKSYETVWSTIEGMFLKAKERDEFNSATWDRLDEVASHYVTLDCIKCRRTPNFNPKNILNLGTEKGFVLRLMQHVFSLYSKELPGYFDYKLRYLDEKGFHLQEPLRKALHILLETQQITSKHIGEDYLKNWYTISFNRFRANEYLKMCVFFTKCAFEDYYFYRKPFTLYKVFVFCVKLLQDVKERGLPEPWADIHHAAIDILGTEMIAGILEDAQVGVVFHDFKNEIYHSELREFIPVLHGRGYGAIIEERFPTLENIVFDNHCGCCMCSFLFEDLPELVVSSGDGDTSDNESDVDNDSSVDSDVDNDSSVDSAVVDDFSDDE